MSEAEILSKILSFLEEIGIPVIEKKIDEACFMPGLTLKEGAILMDRKRLKYPGDLLHEAGHLAVTEKEKRVHIGTDLMDASWPSDGDEISSILWSYAALHHLKIPAKVVFHPNGYKNESEWLIDQFENKKNYLGLALFQWMGFCGLSEAEEKSVYPKVIKWLR